MSAGDLALALKGFTFIANPRMVVGQMVRRPRSKRYRILKKWANRPENMRYAPMPGLFYMQDARAVIGHPDNIAALKRKLAESEQAGIAAFGSAEWEKKNAQRSTLNAQLST